MAFSDAEIEYLQAQPLARIGTVSPGGQVDVAPVRYAFDGTRFYITGLRQTRTLKYKNVVAGQALVALVIDDLATVDPWRPRGVKVHGTATIQERDGAQPALVITPTVHWSWGLDGSSYTMQRTEWERA